jgi:hypothetical protein
LKCGVVVLDVDEVPLGPDERSALVWRAGGVVVVVLGEMTWH